MVYQYEVVLVQNLDTAIIHQDTPRSHLLILFFVGDLYRFQVMLDAFQIKMNAVVIL